MIDSGDGPGMMIAVAEEELGMEDARVAILVIGLSNGIYDGNSSWEERLCNEDFGEKGK